RFPAGRLRDLSQSPTRPVCPEDSDWDVDQKNRTPGEELYENTAQSIAGDRTSIDSDLIYPDALSQSFTSESIRNNSHTIDEEKRSTNALNKPERQELLCCQRETGQKRTNREYPEAHV